MRILYCTTDGWNAFNGINAWLLRFLPALRDRGHDARVLLFNWSAPADCTTLPLLVAAGVPVDLVDRARDTEAAVRSCLRHIGRSAPDVFVPNHVLPALYAAGWARASGIPTIGMLHNDDEEYGAKARLFAGDDDFFRLSAIVAISAGLTQLVEARPGLMLRCIPYGQSLPPQKAGWDGHQPLRLVYHGRIVQKQKRILETVAACVRVCRVARGAIEADFYGSGPEERALVEAIARDDAGGRVRFQGRFASTEAAAILSRYHVAVLLSDYEGLGLSILEAMSAGLVPVCLRTDRGLPDLIKDGENGIFVDDRETAFDLAIRGLLDDPLYWQRLSTGARSTVATRFSPTDTLSAWESLMMALLAQRSEKSPATRLRRLDLPDVHPALRNEDRRYPGLARSIWRRIRFPARR